MDMEYFDKIHNCAELIEYIDKVGFLPLLNIGIAGWSAEEVVDEDCGYTVLPEGGWEWPLWQWKGDIIRDSGCAYGKFFNKKAAFISREWWPDICNYRRKCYHYPEEGSIDEAILATLEEHGSMITRELRAACGFTGKNMRSKFDSYITRLEMGSYIVTEDFIYPQDRHGHEYGWGWALLTTPEALFGQGNCMADCATEESYQRMAAQLRKIIPNIDDKTIRQLLQ